MLSPRQRQIVSLVAKGKLNKEIAHDLSLTDSTVKEYLFRIFRKVGVTNRTELAVWWITKDKPGKVVEIYAEGVAKVG